MTIKIVGKTDTGMLLLQGCFSITQFISTPLSLIARSLYTKGYVIDWIDFGDSAIQSGWEVEMLIDRLKNVLFSVYDQKFSEDMIRTLEKRYDV